MVNYLVRGACDWIMCGWDAWDEWRMIVGFFCVWLKFGKVLVRFGSSKIEGRKMQ